MPPPGARPPPPNTPNDRENPLTALPDVDLSHDAVVVTHRHGDHLDDAARERLPADAPLFCQPAEADDVAAAVDHADCPVAAVHMDAIDHCLRTRATLRAAVPAAVVPEDGASLDV